MQTQTFRGRRISAAETQTEGRAIALYERGSRACFSPRPPGLGNEQKPVTIHAKTRTSAHLPIVRRAPGSAAKRSRRRSAPRTGDGHENRTLTVVVENVPNVHVRRGARFRPDPFRRSAGRGYGQRGPRLCGQFLFFTFHLKPSPQFRYDTHTNKVRFFVFMSIGEVGPRPKALTSCKPWVYSSNLIDFRFSFTVSPPQLTARIEVYHS